MCVYVCVGERESKSVCMRVCVCVCVCERECVLFEDLRDNPKAVKAVVGVCVCVWGRKRNSVFVYTVLYSLLLVSHKNYHTDTICVHVHTCVHVSHTNLQTHATRLYICTS